VFTIYTLFIRIYSTLIALAAPFNAKAKLWHDGRLNWRARTQAQASALANHRVIWVHAASLGEFEQGRPLIEAIKNQYPEWQIVLSFFSPSGYEIRKNYPFADLICYLPADTPENARDFIKMIQPTAAVFVKYEFWGNYLKALKNRGVPTLLISGIFRPSQPFFKWYGAFWRSMLGCFNQFFVQNEASAKLLQSVGFQNITVAGDTRVDRVLQIAEKAATNDVVATFIKEAQANERPVFIAGSSWGADEKVYLPVLQSPEFQDYKLIIAPHDPALLDEKITNLDHSVRYSQAQPEQVVDKRVLIIDNIGMLNTLYRYGTVAYIGGGFGKGIHNTLEPAAFGLPVIFGPKYHKFEEARQLIAAGGAFSVETSSELKDVLLKLQDKNRYQQASTAVTAWLRANEGATLKILSFLLQIPDKNS
jgi:3-deoxy-D-manno-octulosonic-acid transferase